MENPLKKTVLNPMLTVFRQEGSRWRLSKGDKYLVVDTSHLSTNLKKKKLLCTIYRNPRIHYIG